MCHLLNACSLIGDRNKLHIALTQERVGLFVDDCRN